MTNRPISEINLMRIKGQVDSVLADPPRVLVFKQLYRASRYYALPFHFEPASAAYRMRFPFAAFVASDMGIDALAIKLKELGCELSVADGYQIFTPDIETAALLKLSI